MLAQQQRKVPSLNTYPTGLTSIMENNLSLGAITFSKSGTFPKRTSHIFGKSVTLDHYIIEKTMLCSL